MGRSGRSSLPPLAQHSTRQPEGCESLVLFFRGLSLHQIMTSMNPKANVLIDENGHARLTDLGLASTVLGNRSVVGLLEANLTTGTRWAAPEISKGGSVTKAGEVFTFAMVAFEVCTSRFRKNLSNLFVSGRRLRSIPYPSKVTLLC